MDPWEELAQIDSKQAPPPVESDPWAEVASMSPPEAFSPPLQSQTPQMDNRPTQFDLGATINAIGQNVQTAAQPLAQELQAATQSVPAAAQAVGNFASGLPLAITELGDTAGGIENALQDVLMSPIPDGEIKQGFQRAMRKRTNLSEKLKESMPSTNTALAGVGSAASQMAIPIGGAATEASMLKAMGQGALQMGGLSAIQDIGQQYGKTGKIDLPELAATTALGSALGAGGAGLVHGAGSAIAKNNAYKALVAKKNAPKRIEQLHLQELARQKQIALDNYHAANDLEIATDKARREAQYLDAMHKLELKKKEDALNQEIQKANARHAEFQRLNAEHDMKQQAIERQHQQLSAMGKQLEAAKARQAGIEGIKDHIKEVAKRLDEHRVAAQKQEYLDKIDAELAQDAERRQSEYFGSRHRAELLEREQKLQDELRRAGLRHQMISESQPLPSEIKKLEKTKSEAKPKTVREKAVELRQPSRLGTAQEHKALSGVVEAKRKADMAIHHFEQAFNHVVEHLEHHGYSTDGAFVKSPDVIPPETGAQIREAAKELAGIEGPLRETKHSEPNLIRDAQKSEPFSDYEMRGKNAFEKIVELKHLKQLAKRFQDEYVAARDAAKIGELVKDGTAVELNHAGQNYRIENRTQVKYEPPKNASAKQKVEYEAEVEAGYKRERDKFDEILKPSIKGLSDALSKSHPDLARILKAQKPVIDDARIIEAADRMGVKDDLYHLIKGFIEDESGSAPTGFGADVLQSASVGLLKTVQHVSKMARKLGLTPELTMRISANEFTHDIYKRAADPIFVADYEKQLGELALATQGVELPRTPEGIEAWFTLKKPEDIRSSVHLDSKQQDALIRLNEVKKKTAAILKQEISDLYERAENAGEKISPFVGYGAQIRAMKYDLEHNFERTHSANLDIIKNVSNFIAHNTVNTVQLGNVGLHFIHAVEGHVAFQSSSPWGFAKAVGLYAKRDKEALAFAHSFNMKMPNWGLREDSMNPISMVNAKIQNAIIKRIPGSDSALARNVSDAISGRGVEQQKMIIGLLTASHYAAKEMGYKGGASALRKALMTSTLSEADRLAAATHMMKFMGRTIGAGPAGYTHMNVIDRAAMEAGGIARIFAPFTRSLQTQSAFFNRELVDGMNAFEKGDLAKSASHFSTLLHAAAITTMWSGAAAIPLSLRNAIGEHAPDKLEQLEETLNKCAIIGNALGIRSTHTRPEPLWLLRTGRNLLSQGVENYKAITDSKAGENKKQHAMLMMGSVLTGINNIADTVSFDELRKIYAHAKESQAIGGNIKWVYTEDGPFGITKGDYVASRKFAESNPIAAGIKTFLRFGETKGEADFEERAIRNHLAEIAFKNTYGEDVHKAMREMYTSQFETSEEYRKFPKEAARYGIDMSGDKLNKLKRMQYDQRKSEEERQLDIGGKKVPAASFWVGVFELLQEHPERAQALRKALEPEQAPAPSPSTPIAQN